MATPVRYAYMFEKNKGPTKQLDALLRAIARHTVRFPAPSPIPVARSLTRPG